MTSVSVGSLLDDHLWHDVKIERSERMVNLTVDRVEVSREVDGVFRKLDLNAKVRVIGEEAGWGKWRKLGDAGGGDNLLWRGAKRDGGLGGVRRGKLGD